MPRCRFVTPETVRLDLSDGDWIEVKKILNIGERKVLESTGIRRGLFSPPEVDWAEYAIGRTFVWLTEWSFRDDADRPKELTLDAIRNLDEETFEEIQDALTKHIQEIEDLKKTKASTPTA